MDKWLKSVQSWWLPAICLLCGAAGRGGLDICSACCHELPWQGAACERCGEALATMGVCGHCQRNPPAFDRTYAVFDYAEPIDRLVHELKFHGKLHTASLLGLLMGQRLLAQVSALPDLLLPVPLHPQRLRQRGFNQSVELGRWLAREMELPLSVDGCRRRRATPAQVGQSAEARRHNLAGAFEVVADVRGKRVALLDDVMTTGSTVDALATVLQRAGVGQVQVWVCARASRLR